MAIEIRLLGPRDGAVLANVSADVFDGPVNPGFTAEFLGDARHHLAVALDAGLVVAMASAVHYLHPDKPPELWINEVGVAETHRFGEGSPSLGKMLNAWGVAEPAILYIVYPHSGADQGRSRAPARSRRRAASSSPIGAASTRRCAS